MITNIVEHLENIKIFTDFKRTDLDTIDFFWDHISSGGSIYNIGDQIFDFDTLDDDFDPTTEELERDLNDKQALENRDLCEEYVLFVRSKIDMMLSYDKAEIPASIELSQLYDHVIDKYPNLWEYLNTTEEIFSEYVALAENCLPQNFFKELLEHQKRKGETVITYKEVEIPTKNPYPNIFKDLNAFKIFENWIEARSTDSDCAYIYRKMKDDRLIYNYVGESEFVNFLSEEYCLIVGKLKTLEHISQKNRSPIYYDLKENYPM